jgi:uncharacterized protein YggE
MKNKIVASVILLSSITFLMNSCQSDNSKGELKNKIEVMGSSEMELIPDEIYLTFTLKEYLKDNHKIKIENIKTTFLDVCKKAGLNEKDISIENYNGNETYNYYWYYRRKREPNFVASISYQIKVKTMDKIDEIVNEMNPDAVENFYINKVSHSEIEEKRKEVKNKAVIACKTKAEGLLNSIGEKIGNALLIQEIENDMAATPSYGFAGMEDNLYSNSIAKANYEVDNSSINPSIKSIKLRYVIKAEFEIK